MSSCEGQIHRSVTALLPRVGDADDSRWREESVNLRRARLEIVWRACRHNPIQGSSHRSNNDGSTSALLVPDDGRSRSRRADGRRASHEQRQPRQSRCLHRLALCSRRATHLSRELSWRTWFYRRHFGKDTRRGVAAGESSALRITALTLLTGNRLSFSRAGVSSRVELWDPRVGRTGLRDSTRARSGSFSEREHTQSRRSSTDVYTASRRHRGM